VLLELERIISVLLPTLPLEREMRPTEVKFCLEGDLIYAPLWIGSSFISGVLVGRGIRGHLGNGSDNFLIGPLYS
jgi:hypothetical protein